MKTRSEIGTSSRRKGLQAERDLAKYLRQWWPAAERKVDTGWRTRNRHSADLGDIRGTPNLVWQVKNVDRMSSLAVEAAISDAERQATAAGADYALLVQRRDGKADPGRWWCWMRVGDLVALATPRDYPSHPPSAPPAPTSHTRPVRLELHDAVALLLAAGYGEQGDESKWSDPREDLQEMVRFAVCPRCSAEHPDFHSPVGSLETACDRCGWTSEKGDQT